MAVVIFLSNNWIITKNRYTLLELCSDNRNYVSMCYRISSAFHLYDDLKLLEGIR